VANFAFQVLIGRPSLRLLQLMRKHAGSKGVICVCMISWLRIFRMIAVIPQGKGNPIPYIWIRSGRMFVVVAAGMLAHINWSALLITTSKSMELACSKSLL